MFYRYNRETRKMSGIEYDELIGSLDSIEYPNITCTLSKRITKVDAKLYLMLLNRVRVGYDITGTPKELVTELDIHKLDALYRGLKLGKLIDWNVHFNHPIEVLNDDAMKVLTAVVATCPYPLYVDHTMCEFRRPDGNKDAGELFIGDLSASECSLRLDKLAAEAIMCFPGDCAVIGNESAVAILNKATNREIVRLSDDVEVMVAHDAIFVMGIDETYVLNKTYAEVLSLAKYGYTMHISLDSAGALRFRKDVAYEIYHKHKGDILKSSLYRMQDDLLSDGKKLCKVNFSDHYEMIKGHSVPLPADGKVSQSGLEMIYALLRITGLSGYVTVNGEEVPIYCTDNSVMFDDVDIREADISSTVVLTLLETCLPYKLHRIEITPDMVSALKAYSTSVVEHIGNVSMIYVGDTLCLLWYGTKGFALGSKGVGDVLNTYLSPVPVSDDKSKEKAETFENLINMYIAQRADKEMYQILEEMFNGAGVTATMYEYLSKEIKGRDLTVVND